MGPGKRIPKKKFKPHRDEKLYFDHYNPSDLETIIDTQYKVTAYLKKQNKKKLFQILIVIDDFADSPEFTRKSPLLHQLYTRGRPSMISTITATQVYKVISPIVRKNVTDLIIFELRNYADLEGIVEEVSAVADKKTIHNIYKQATEEPFNFLYVRLTAKNINDMFWINFDQQIIVDEYREDGGPVMDEYENIDQTYQNKGKGKGYDMNSGLKGKGKGYM